MTGAAWFGIAVAVAVTGWMILAQLGAGFDRFFLIFLRSCAIGAIAGFVAFIAWRAVSWVMT